MGTHDDNLTLVTVVVAHQQLDPTPNKRHPCALPPKGSQRRDHVDLPKFIIFDTKFILFMQNSYFKYKIGYRRAVQTDVDLAEAAQVGCRTAVWAELCSHRNLSEVFLGIKLWWGPVGVVVHAPIVRVTR